MRVLILGATGSIGVHTALYLKEQGHEVLAFGHRESDNGFFSDYGIPYYSFDLRQKESFDRIPDGIDAVVHFAGSMPARMQGYHPHDYIDTIVTGTLNVLEWMSEKNVNKIVFSQSISDVLYKFGTTTPIDDDSERRFPKNSDHSVYAIAKNAAVNLIQHYSARFGIENYVLRLPTIYVYHPNPYYFVDGKKRCMGYRILIERAMKGEELEVWGNPKSTKEMVYVKDFAQIVKCCIDTKGKCGIYNVGCGTPISIEDQIRIIADVFNSGHKSVVVYRPEKPSSPQFILSIDKARRELGYQPQYGFEKMMRDFKDEMEHEPFAKLWGYKEEYE